MIFQSKAKEDGSRRKEKMVSLCQEQSSGTMKNEQGKKETLWSSHQHWPDVATGDTRGRRDAVSTIHT